jgi:SAM-dependent methyltransferase
MIDAGSRRPNVARIHDFLLGGKDNYAEDRQVADGLLAVVPGARAAARANRRFLVRAVRFLATEAGIGQFIDIGTGFPAAGHVHQVTQGLEPRPRVVYVDNDPIVVSHARALLCRDPGVRAIEGDARDPAGILDHPDVRAVVDLGEPVALVLSAVLHFLAEEDSPDKLVQLLKAAVAPGSYLVISHATGDGIGAEVAGQVQELYAETTAPAVLRSRAEIARFFAGLDLVAPGLGDVAAWRAGAPPAEPGPVIVLGGVGRKP